jgi:hypothetical protein
MLRMDPMLPGATKAGHIFVFHLNISHSRMYIHMDNILHILTVT